MVERPAVLPPPALRPEFGKFVIPHCTIYISPVVNFPNYGQAQFESETAVTWDLAKKLDDYLLGWFQFSIPIFVNSMAINLKLPVSIRKLNSCLIVLPRGSGKNAIFDCFQLGNPQIYVRLDEKVFESELAEKGREYFHNKILVQPDALSMFKGLNKKQLQQLLNFWVQLLDSGNYSRTRHGVKGVKTLVFFGIAAESIAEFKKEFFDTTFLDRVTPYSRWISDEEKERILEFRSRKYFENLPPPKIKLPLPSVIEDKKKKEIKFPRLPELEAAIQQRAMELDLYGIQSSNRSQDFIRVFMMSNALLNGRKLVTVGDFLVYEFVHELFINAGRNLNQEFFIQSLFRSNPGKTDQELIDLGQVKKTTFYKYKRILKRKKLI
jgi:hypothetical protein